MSAAPPSGDRQLAETIKEATHALEQANTMLERLADRLDPEVFDARHLEVVKDDADA